MLNLTGATYKGQQTGTLEILMYYQFNGNKIIYRIRQEGMLITNDFEELQIK